MCLGGVGRCVRFVEPVAVAPLPALWARGAVPALRCPGPVGVGRLQRASGQGLQRVYRMSSVVCSRNRKGPCRSAATPLRAPRTKLSSSQAQYRRDNTEVPRVGGP